MPNVKTTYAPPMFPQGQQSFASWLFGNVGQGLPAYQADLFPNLATTLLPQVYGQWNAGMNQQDAGSMMLLDLLRQRSPFGNDLQTQINNVGQFGGIGWPGQQMSLAAQYGGAGASAPFMSNIMQFGMPGAVGQPVADIARTGGTGTWGNQLQNYALMQNNPSIALLAPFLGAKPWASPTMNLPAGGKK